VRAYVDRANEREALIDAKSRLSGELKGRCHVSGSRHRDRAIVEEVLIDLMLKEEVRITRARTTDRQQKGAPPVIREGWALEVRKMVEVRNVGWSWI
jgi:hypothetical protein